MILEQLVPPKNEIGLLIITLAAAGTQDSMATMSIRIDQFSEPRR